MKSGKNILQSYKILLHLNSSFHWVSEMCCLRSFSSSPQNTVMLSPGRRKLLSKPVRIFEMLWSFDKFSSFLVLCFRLSILFHVSYCGNRYWSNVWHSWHLKCELQLYLGNYFQYWFCVPFIFAEWRLLVTSLSSPMLDCRD